MAATNVRSLDALGLTRSDDNESRTPIEVVSDGGECAYASMSFGRYTSDEVLQMWAEMLRQFEEKLKPFYDSLMEDLEEQLRRNLQHHTPGRTEINWAEIMQALVDEMCTKVCRCIENKFAQA